MTTTRTHEIVELRLRTGLERTLPRPRIVVPFATKSAADFLAFWALDGRLCVLVGEVKTTKRATRAPRLEPYERDLRRDVERLSEIVSPTRTPLLDRKPVLMYAAFVYRKRPTRWVRGEWVHPEEETFIYTTSRLAQHVLATAWKNGGHE